MVEQFFGAGDQSPASADPFFGDRSGICRAAETDLSSQAAASVGFVAVQRMCNMIRFLVQVSGFFELLRH